MKFKITTVQTNLVNPFNVILEEIQGLRNDVRELKDSSINEKQPHVIEYCRSIKEISSFLGCCDSTSQGVLNKNPGIVIKIGVRKFMVRKADLIEAFGNRKKKNP